MQRSRLWGCACMRARIGAAALHCADAGAGRGLQRMRISSAKVVQFIRERRGIITSLAVLNADGYWSGAHQAAAAVRPAQLLAPCTACGSQARPCP